MKTYKSFSDLGAAFDRLIKATFFNYKGNILEQTLDGYKMSGKHYKSLEEIDAELEKQYKAFEKTINHE